MRLYYILLPFGMKSDYNSTTTNTTFDAGYIGKVQYQCGAVELPSVDILFGTNVIGTARDAGNLAAGYLSGRSGISFALTRFAFDVYQRGIEPPVSRLAQNYGYWMGYYVYIKNTSNIYAK